MKVKEFLRVVPDDVFACYIHNVVVAWFNHMFPDKELNTTACYLFIKTFSEYLEDEADEKIIQGAWNTEKIFRELEEKLKKGE